MNKGADLGLFAAGVSVTRSHMSFYLRTLEGGGNDSCVALFTEGLILAGC